MNKKPKSMMINNKKIIIYSLFIILIINIIVFLPSFDQAPRGSDHYHYLVETSHIDNLSDRLVYSYSYARMRKLASGDQILFRPIFFILLSIETWLFQYNSFYWQATALLLHMLVLWQILKILRFIAQGLIPLLLVLYFSTL
ncbi:MAG: hypothetical protein KAR32_07215, partial [Candidatus Omnitrophica bacterium]|nr:hypothetical protein [Candidatus Omnitrophota bacterium]